MMYPSLPKTSRSLWATTKARVEVEPKDRTTEIAPILVGLSSTFAGNTWIVVELVALRRREVVSSATTVAMLLPN